MTLPKVSVILTSYNHAAYVAAAIESVLNQTFTDFELLIIDDGSIDNSREIIKSFNDPRIKTFLYEENRGPRLAVSEAVRFALGKYIAVHHSDDLWTLDKLEKQVAFLDANENYAACFTWVEFVNEHGNSSVLDESDFYRTIFEQPNRTRTEWLNYFFYNANCLCHPSVMLRREVVEKFHLYEVHGLWQLPDYLAWIRLCFHAEIFILPERLTKFRLRRTRQENTSATTFDKVIRTDLEFYFVAREFVYNFTDNKFFLEVFPEAERFLIDGQINRRFAFAKICLDKKNFAVTAFQLAGLELIKELLDNSATAAEIKTLYNYDEKSFLYDSGSHDVFNLAQKFSMLHAEIFAIDDSEYFKVAEKIINVDTSQKFYGRIDFDLERPIKVLRFDPDINFISLKVNSILINGVAQEIFDDNANEVAVGFRRFWTNDPQIIFKIENLSGHVTFEIFGEIEKNYDEILSRNIKELTERNKELLTENQKLTLANDSILNLNSWKISEQLRLFKDWLHLGNKEKFVSIAHFFYRVLPLDGDKKIWIKNKFYTMFAPLLKNTQHYKNWKASYLMRSVMVTDSKNLIQSEKIPFNGEFCSQPSKIAVYAHIFYLGLLEEMAI